MTSLSYDLSYELDDGEVQGTVAAIHIHGHDIPVEDVELLLHESVDELGLDEGGWDVEECYVRCVPREYGYEHVYCNGPGPGAKRITKVTPYSFWGKWCYNHWYEPATTGYPASQVTNGEFLVQTRLDEERQVVEKTGMGDYIYFCRECATDFNLRLAGARRLALETLT